MSIITFVISTIKYPDSNPGWGSVSLSFPKDVCFHDKMETNYKKSAESSVIAKRKQFSPDHGNNSDIFVVYVIPCLKLDADDSIRGQYYDMIIRQIMDIMNTNYNNIYLIAHEKDFKEEKDHIFVNKIPFHGSYSYLEDLARINHIYLFQHDDDGKIFKYIEDLPKKKPLFNFNSCDNIFQIITKKSEMIDFFNNVDSECSNIYE